MNPTQHTQWLIQWTAAASPWWLLVALPAVIAAAWWLYRRELIEMPRNVRGWLLGMRVVLLALLVCAAFRPNLVSRRTITWPGRIIVVVDDSGSMTTSDNRMPAAEALRLSRDLANDASDTAASLHVAAELTRELSDVLRRFDRDTRDLSRSADAFWEASEQATDAVADLARQLDEAHSRATTSPAFENANISELRTAAADLLGRANAMITSPQPPQRRAMATLLDDLHAFAAAQRLAQQAADEAALASGSPTLEQRVADMRERSRKELVDTVLKSVAGDMPDRVEFMYLSTRSADPDESHLENEAGASEAEVTLPFGTPLIEVLGAAATRDSPFPLAGVIAITDGRDLGDPARDWPVVRDAFVRERVPVHALGAGSGVEPRDIALRDAIAPPFAVAHQPMRLKLRIKAALDEASEVAVHIRPVVAPGNDAPPPQEHTLTLEPGARREASLSINVGDPGLTRYRVDLASIAGEAFPGRNNSVDIAVQVRTQPVRVLLVDQSPRWQTRFVSDILRRIDHVVVNRIILDVQPDGDLKRGSARGTWPDSPEALALYDLVILGDIAPDTLTDSEWSDLRQFVETQGRSVLLLAPGENAIDEPIASLFPLTPHDHDLPFAGELQPLLERDALSRLALTPVGAVHPATIALSRALSVVEGPLPRVTPDAQVLMVEADTKQPLLTVAFRGPGRIALLETDMLWAALNPTQLQAHAQMFVELLTWAVRLDDAPDDNAITRAIALDKRVLSAEAPMNVWLTGGTDAFTLTPTGGNERSGRTFESAPLREGSLLRREVVTFLGGGTYTFKAGDDTITAELLERDRELHDLSRNDALLTAIASETGGSVEPVTQLMRVINRIEPRERIERQERVWRLWDARWLLALVLALLTVEWIARKFAGLV